MTVTVIVTVMATVTVTVMVTVTFEGQPWLHWSVNFEMTMVFCRAALATPVLLTAKMLDPGVKPTLFQSRMNLIYYLGDLIF